MTNDQRSALRIELGSRAYRHLQETPAGRRQHRRRRRAQACPAPRKRTQVCCRCGWRGRRLYPYRWPCHRCGQALIPDGPGFYLLCIKDGYRHARHYSGAAHELQQRIAEQLAGNGSSANLVRVALQAGCEVRVARIWRTRRAFALEAHCKKPPGRTGSRTSYVRLCPFCNPRRWRTNQPMRRMTESPDGYVTWPRPGEKAS